MIACNGMALVVWSWWPRCLDHGALINVEAPGCDTSVFRGFHPGVQLYPTSLRVLKSLNRVLVKEAILV